MDLFTYRRNFGNGLGRWPEIYPWIFKSRSQYPYVDYACSQLPVFEFGPARPSYQHGLRHLDSIGIVGTVIAGLILFQETLTPWQSLSVVLIVAGLIGLRLTSGA